MKTLPTFILLTLLCAAGCSTRYDITTSNGARITTIGKPHYDKSRSTWTYTDLKGKTREISGGSVTQVEPQAMESSDTQQQFNPVVKR